MYIQVVTVNTQCTMNIHYIHCDFVEEIHWKVVHGQNVPLRDFPSVTLVPSAFHLFEGKEKRERFYSSLFMRVEWLGNQ